MRKMRALVALGFAMLVMPMLMGATISFTAVTANPGAQKNTLGATGKYTLANKEKLFNISFEVDVKNSNPFQSTTVGGKADGVNFTWSASALVAPATYNPCIPTIYYFDANNALQDVQGAKNTTDQVVN